MRHSGRAEDRGLWLFNIQSKSVRHCENAVDAMVDSMDDRERSCVMRVTGRSVVDGRMEHSTVCRGIMMAGFGAERVAVIKFGRFWIVGFGFSSSAGSSGSVD